MGSTARLYYPSELTKEFTRITVYYYLDFNRRSLFAVVTMLQNLNSKKLFANHCILH